ncbi:LysM peptidoglycan-binding domain-containing protein [Paenibacillus filicis]|uniref:LysM peptidoglycan-binding domain-containing protein n=1 Tax=Paenibacillus filicis TaxID=669464 RepID=A0ABU9DTD7_9BACL
MTTPSNGLRFDIYERVHVSDEVLGIRQLEGVELVPHIQVLSQGEQALLRGNLLLTGSYVDEQEREGQRLEHLIPVEITLPMSRVTRVEEIAVEIENFDVDLLSPRSLNITGVLSLNGLEVSSSSNGTEPAWRETEEEVVFVHEPSAAQLEEYISDVETRQREEEQGAFQEPAADPASWQGSRHEEPHPPVSAAEHENEEEEAEPVPVVQSEEAVNEWLPEPAPAVEEEKKELKVGFGSKKTSEEQQTAAAQTPAPVSPKTGAFGLSSLINYSASKSEARAAEEAAQAQAAAEAASAQKVELRNLLLSRRGEQQEFKKVRLVIVQKEDTLETIAKKYELNPRELILYNRLGDNELAAGQIVYIPR